ncbi:sodium-independent anion transporter [Phenylobacterium sp. J367]|nr:sodium-independent anion transporter [Phenylobacterium sp. J367]
MYGPLFFGSASRFQEMASTVDANAALLVIRMEEVPYVDQSGLYALEQVAFDLRQKGAQVAPHRRSGTAPRHAAGPEDCP